MSSKHLTPLPDGWTQITFGEVGQLVKGISYSSNQYADSDCGVPFITIKCVSKSGGFKAEGIKYYKGPIRPHELIETGDLLIANTDLTRAGDIVGCPVRLPNLGAPRVTMSMDLSKVNVDQGVADPGFVYHKLMGRPVRSFMREHSSGSTVLHLKTSAVPRLPVQLPADLSEQRKITQVLDTIDIAIHETEAIIAKLKAVKQGLLHDLLTRGVDANGELRPPQAEAPHLYKESPLGWIPKEWGTPLLENVSTRVTDGTHQAVTTVADGGGEVPFLFVSCVRDGEIAWDKAATITKRDYWRISKGREPAAGMVLYTVVGSYGHAAEVGDTREFAFQRHIACIYPDERYVVPGFMPWILNWEIMQRYADRVALGNAQKTITLGELSRYPFVCPKKAEQEEIVRRMRSAQEKLNRELESLDKFRLQKFGLMDDLLTGRVRVTALLAEAAQQQGSA